ncbi:MAG: PAS domain S-box protein [Chloroflexi bacterium]|nr:PAS domain S-box protein [Chloroflexota bacterium]
MNDFAELAQVAIHCAGTDIYIVQNGKKSQHVNSLRQELEGYTEQELRGMHSLDHIYPDDKEAVGKKATENSNGHHLLSYEHMPIKKNGKKNGNGKAIWVLEKATSTEYRGNQAAVGSLVDLIEHERLEEAITDSEERYRAILKEMQDAYFEVDLDGNFTFVSDSLCRLLGYAREELLEMNFRDHIAEAGAEAVYQAFNKVYNTGKTIKNLTYEVTHKNGTTVIAETSASLLRNEQGEIIGFRGIGRDVTEHKRAEEALRRSEERYRAMLDEMEEGYYEVDLAGNITFVNDSICRQFGCAKEDLIGMNYRFYVPKEDVEGVYKTWNKVYRTGESLKSYHFAITKKGRTQIFLENSVSLLRDNEGKIIGFRSISRDDTERKQLVQKLAELAWPSMTC